MKQPFFKSFLLTTIATSPLVLSNCTLLPTPHEPAPLTQEQKDRQTITRFVQTLSPDHLYKIPLIERSLHLLLKSPEGTKVLRSLKPEIQLNIEQNDPTVSGLAQQNNITLSASEITKDNETEIALITAHEITHTSTPRLPTRLLNQKPAYNLSLNQFLTLYKLNEINALITEMQICVEWGINPDNLPAHYQSYIKTYEKIYHQLPTTQNEQTRKKIATKQTKAIFFKTYLNPEVLSEIDPDFNPLYETRAIQFILDGNIHLSATDVPSTAYDSCLEFYRAQGGDFLKTADLTVNHMTPDNLSYRVLQEAVHMDAFFQKNHPEHNYTLQNIFNSLNPENRLQKRYKPKTLKTRSSGRVRE